MPMFDSVKIKCEYAYFEKPFDDDFINSILEIGENSDFTESQIQEGKTNDVIRKSKNSWIYHMPETAYIFQAMASVTTKLNMYHFGFDVDDVEPMQYTVYDEKDSHYDYHIDSYMGNINTNIYGLARQRKLTTILQLSDPSEYEGGEIEIKTGAEALSIKKSKGYLITFPSFLLHRVTPVTKGVRKSLVLWSLGPDFR